MEFFGAGIQNVITNRRDILRRRGGVRCGEFRPVIFLLRRRINRRPYIIGEGEKFNFGTLLVCPASNQQDAQKQDEQYKLLHNPTTFYMFYTGIIHLSPRKINICGDFPDQPGGARNFDKNTSRTI